MGRPPKAMLLAGALLLSSALLQAQPEILLALPNSGIPGQTVNLIVQAENTHFAPGLTSLDLGPGIDVLQVDVQHSTSLSATIAIGANAPPGLHTLRITTTLANPEVVELEDAFEVADPGSQVTAYLEVVPVNALYTADFDITNLSNGPLLFTVRIINDQIARDMIIDLEMFGEENGILFTGHKEIDGVQPLALTVFDNREFDWYNTTQAGDNIVDVAAQTGMLAPDLYTYRIIVKDDQGNPLAEAEGVNLITNPVSQLELIGPGSPTDEDPEVQIGAQPYFQWFSDASTFDFVLYPVYAGQVSPQEWTLNQPVFEMPDHQLTALPYPNSAEPLVPGQRYAWQVTAKLTGGSGTQTITSPMFHFEMGSADQAGALPVGSATELSLQPMQITILANETYQFQALAHDDNGNLLTSGISWSVVPKSAGTIDPSGQFSSGPYPGTCAVIAEINGLQEYATVIVGPNDPAPASDLERMVRALFGLTPETDAK